MGSDNEKCPYDEGDRVDHKIFGFGTVSGTPVMVFRPDLSHPQGHRWSGWRVPVKWDDPDRPEGEIHSSSLILVRTADARPFSYYDRQWQLLVQNWINARRKFESVAKRFRPPPDKSELMSLMNQEDEAWSLMQSFLEDEQKGRHP